MLYTDLVPMSRHHHIEHIVRQAVRELQTIMMIM